MVEEQQTHFTFGGIVYSIPDVLTALVILRNNLEGNGLDYFKPMPASQCSELARYAQAIIEGRSNQEAQDIARNGDE